MKKRNFPVTVMLLSAVALVAASCGNDDDTAADTTFAAVETTAATTETTATATTETTAATGASPANGSIPAGPIRFGVSVPLSGPTAAFGLAAKASFEIATNANLKRLYPDGIAGHPIQIDILDDASDVTRAVQVANQFVANKVAGVVTVSYNPAGASQQLAVLTRNKIPYLGARGESEYEDTAKFPYVFNISASTSEGAQKLAEWVGRRSEIRTIAALSDGLPATEDAWNRFTEALGTAAPDAEITKVVSITPGSVDVSAAIAELRAANPDLLYVGASFNYGPIWQAIQAANWNPTIYVSAGAWYDGFTAMGPLADKAVTTYSHCVATDREPLPEVVTQAMDGYVEILGTNTVNYLTYVGTDDVPIILLKMAIEKYNSTDPDDIKRALEEVTNVKILDLYEFTFSPDDHSGLVGELATAVCNVAESKFAFGKYRIPTVAD